MKKNLLSLFSAFLISFISINTYAEPIDIPEEPKTNITSTSSIEEIRAELNDMDVYLLEFSMQDGAFPTFDVVSPPEGCSGLSITNNEYVQGSLRMTYKGEVVYESGDYVKKESGVRVKVRGNTSSAIPSIKKKSYKVKLEKKEDLLFRGDKNLRDKEWVLLGYAGDRFHYVAGFGLGRELGLGWQPEIRHVAVIMNEKYIGSYYLAESIKGGENRVDIEDSGYIIENDAYWWKPGEVYFKSNHQLYNVGWTFKEPDEDDLDDMTIENIKGMVNLVEESIYNEDENVESYVDFESFARWLLAHDIMNTVDPIGSNVYVIKKDFIEETPFSTKLTMGPLWDVDDCFRDETEVFALIHRFREFWFFKLFNMPEFRKIYDSNWEKARENIKDRVLEIVHEYLVENPELYKLRVMDRDLGLLSAPMENPYQRYNELSEWFDNRLPVLQKLLDETSGIHEIVDGGMVENPGNTRSFTLDGLPADENSRGVIITIDENGKSSKMIK